MADVESPQRTLEELRNEHSELEQRLDQLERPRSMSPEEEQEVQVIKKRKLALKDQMTKLEEQQGA